MEPTQNQPEYLLGVSSPPVKEGSMYAAAQRFESRRFFEASTKTLKEYEAMQQRRTLTDSEIQSRYGTHIHTDEATVVSRQVRAKIIEMATFLDSILPPGREKDVVLTELETVSMWSQKSISTTSPTLAELPV